MRDVRLFVNSVLLALPALVLTFAGGYILVDKVPELERREKRRVQNEYRELAVQAKDGGLGEQFDFKASGYQRRDGRAIQKEPWGYERGLVWYFKGDKAFRLRVELVEETDFRRLFYPSVALTLCCLFALTAIGIRFFWRFLRARDDFMAAAAHDLTTPLVGMRRMIGRNDEEARRLNERMILLVDNIKDFLRLGGQRKKPDLKPVDIVALTHEAYSLFSADYADSEGGSVAFTLLPAPHSLIPSVRADQTLTLQILWNLFGNDLKYAAPYGKVEVRFSAVGEKMTVEFSDEGPGMSARQMRKAFDRYYRAKTVLSSGKGGFGIGLCTAREFARAMGGDLTVRANVPKGCVFSLTLLIAEA